MQHYGAPTRILDVTLSPHIATYFAMESGYKDSVIFAFDHVALTLKGEDSKDMRREILSVANSKRSPYVALFVPKMTTERLLAQQGVFLVPNRIGMSLKSILSKQKNPKEACIRIVIPAKLRLSGIERLRAMNLTSTALFPGIEGFCRSMRFQIFERAQTQGLLKQ